MKSGKLSHYANIPEHGKMLHLVVASGIVKGKSIRLIILQPV